MIMGSLEYTCGHCGEAARHVRYDIRKRQHWYCAECWMDLRLRLLIDINRELDAKEKDEQAILGDR
jgi:transposase-like protein